VVVAVAADQGPVGMAAVVVDVPKNRRKPRERPKHPSQKKPKSQLRKRKRRNRPNRQPLKSPKPKIRPTQILPQKLQLIHLLNRPKKETEAGTSNLWNMAVHFSPELSLRP
jgi:hypothetical protein